MHKRTVGAGVLLRQAEGTVTREGRTFGALTADLLALSDWLSAQQTTVVAMESTGVYWQPVSQLLEEEEAEAEAEAEGRTLLLANPEPRKRVPGRKTAVKDAEWLAALLRHGLRRASFIPPQPGRDLRALVRSRTTLVQERAEEVNRLREGCARAPTASSPRSPPLSWA